jgi:hypothetical protein
MDKITNPKSANAKLSLKKENLQHLKVRTDLKGGLAAKMTGECGTCHCERFALNVAAVVNPIAR